MTKLTRQDKRGLHERKRKRKFSRLINTGQLANYLDEKKGGRHYSKIKRKK